MKKPLLVLLYLLIIVIGLPVVSEAQKSILSGVVLDEASNTHLSFVRIEVNKSKINAVTDINGMFSVVSDEPIRYLLFTKLGYQPLLTDVTDKTSPLVIKLIPASNSLDSLNHSLDSLMNGISDVYHYRDSIMHYGSNFKIKRTQESMLSGEVEVSWFTFDLNHLKRYNQFEGLYLGFGGQTNDQLFRSVSLGGYAGYGFHDRKTKYGFDISAWPDKYQHLTIKAEYSYDTRESGGSRFFDEKSGALDPEAFRSFYVNLMDYEQKMSLSLYSKHKHFDFFAALQRKIIERGYDISNGVNVLLPDQYNVSGIVAGFRFAPGEKFGHLSGDYKSKYSELPVVWFQLTRGITGMLKGEYNYNRLEGKIQFGHKIKHLGFSSLQVVGNLLDGNAPYFEYFNGRGTFGNFGIYAPGSFVTMHPEEFMNDRSLGIFFSHDFGPFLYQSDFSSPSPVLLFNYGWGNLIKNPDNYFLSMMDMHKGFFETGIQFNNLLDFKVYGLGMGAFYRMGAYSNPLLKDNLVFKIVISFPGKH